MRWPISPDDFVEFIKNAIPLDAFLSESRGWSLFRLEFSKLKDKKKRQVHDKNVSLFSLIQNSVISYVRTLK